MAQTTDGMSFAAHYMGLSTDGSSYTEFSGHSNSVVISGGERVTGHGYTAEGDTAIIKSGKRQPITVTARVVYTEVASDPYDTANDAYETPSDLYIRWSPGGGDSGDLGYTTSVGVVKQPVYPMGDVESGEPVFCEIVLECASVTESSIGTAGW